MDQQPSPVPGHFRASLDNPTASNFRQSSGNLHRSIDARVRNRLRNRLPSQRYYPTDINNNQKRVIKHPVKKNSDPKMFLTQTFLLPPVSSGFAVLQLVLYFFREILFDITSDEDVYVSWTKVVKEGEVWRLLYAQFFNFSKVLLFFNVVTLMAMGRFLEQKIRRLPYALLIIFLGVVSNLLYILLNDMICSGPANEHTVGFGTTMFALRMIHIFTMDSNADNGKGDPNLIFGFLPLHLPAAIAPWQPLVETIFFDVAIIGRCVAANISGMCAGLLFPYLMKNFRGYIMLPRNPPPPPPRRRSRHTISRRSSQSSNNSNGDEDENGNQVDDNNNVDNQNQANALDNLLEQQRQNEHLHDS